MTKRFFSLLLITLLIGSCAPAITYPTATTIPPTFTKTATQTPPPTETTVPTMTDSAPAILPEQQAAIKLLDQYGIDPDTYILTEVDGVIVGTDKETGVEILHGGRFDIRFAVDTIAAKSCEPTDFRPSRDGLMLGEYAQAFSRYIEKIVEELNYQRWDGARSHDILLDRKNKCWGYFYGGKDLLYRDKEGVAHKLPLIALTDDEIEAFQISR